MILIGISRSGLPPKERGSIEVMDGYASERSRGTRRKPRLPFYDNTVISHYYRRVTTKLKFHQCLIRQRDWLLNDWIAVFAETVFQDVLDGKIAANLV